MKKSLHGPNGLRVDLDSAEIFPDDPGAGTPAMVRLFGFSATYGCASDTGELTDSRCDCRELTATQLNWLQSPAIEAAVSEFIEGNSK